ncbi:MAG: aminotransferase class IV [Candidatus Omnitrophica bacterium]|nr:aminotransferase class IV [Candidatus Omnitrophota bacterium]MDD5592538.1 aminotransferase class IV [Candidatus Omnitrophota bacterium]
MKEIIFLNGKFLPLREAKISILTPGFLYGWGLFETMRAYHEKIVYFNAHLERINRSCKLIGINMPYSRNKLKGIIQETVKTNAFTDARVRLTLWKFAAGADTLVSVKKYCPYSYAKYKNGFRACVSSFRQNEGSHLAQLKTTSYLLYRLAYQQAKEQGFDESVILNPRGYICEGSSTNIFLVKNQELWTPALECGCLNGITRKAVLDLAKKYHIKAYEGNLSLPDLYAADEAFLTNSLLGIMPLAAVEKQRAGKGTGRYRITRFFMQEYHSLLTRGT